MRFKKLKFKKAIQICVVSLFFVTSVKGQFSDGSEGTINGNFQIGGQYYVEDAQNESIVLEPIMGAASFANLIYTKGNFSTGVRVESYEPALLGYRNDPLALYEGTGIGYRYAKYSVDDITITAGNFYEQFGSGLMLRTYEERNLGIDNSLDGINVNYSPYKGITLKGVYGRQRLGFSDGTTKGPGIVRGVDSEIMLNDLLDSTFQSKTRITLGGSFVSRYQQENDPALIIPENVGIFGGRININRGKVNVYSEYAYKINDPSADNGFIYKNGQAFLLNSTFSQKGIGITLGTQFVDNMFYRSDRNAPITDLLINYIPAVPRQHTYNLPATLYPYATQPAGEIGFTGEIMYKFKKDSPLGGRYGTTVSLNSSFVKGLDTTNIVHDATSETPADLSSYGKREGYTTDLLSLSGETYFRDIHVEINKKMSKKTKLNLMFINFIYNADVIEGPDKGGRFGSMMQIVDMSYKINRKNAMRVELQALQAGYYFMKDENGKKHSFNIDKNAHQGHWLTGIVEYTYSPHWFVAVQNQYRLGNDNPKFKALHYPLLSFGYTQNATRFMVTGGRQREGLFCVGGVCRQVPASTGVSLTITSSF